MNSNLAILVPSRGRPENLARLIQAVHKTVGSTSAHVIAGIDKDDPRYDDYIKVRDTIMQPGDLMFASDDRQNLVQWTNHLEQYVRGQYGFYASFGDDMVPTTRRWNVKLISAINSHFEGTGIVYPWTDTRDDIPEAYVISADIPKALGWVMMPKLSHWYNDNVIADIGHGAGCIKQLRGVVVRHLNVGMGRAQVDQTALDAGKGIPADEKIYNEWKRHEMASAVQIVRKLRAVLYQQGR